MKRECKREQNRSCFQGPHQPKLMLSNVKNTFVVVDGGHLLHKVVWNMNFEDISKSYLRYLQTHYGSNVAVVFDGYPSDVNGNSAKSAERIRRANLHSSHEIIFNEATCPETSQEQFLANERNKVHFIDLLKKFLRKANVTVKQAIQKWLGHEKNPLEWGWVPKRFGLSPRKMERDAASESLLKIISCNCKKRCKNACGCRKAGLICSSLCTCSLGEACENVSDISLLEDSIKDEDDTPSSINNFIYKDIEDLYLQLEGAADRA
ncbi:hypothetical protein AVEN_234181-1 [Araneus ventricosus]|uniref:Tesmin/TSO1-like CXC domain-containing protein n=1 Tax=Araneus ventricosus TaxID=182803 RepID=A0A4Y2ML96_ARAVE|nr:hypothetical protein AVEN_234181-1 [Araneus ventricosus]